MPVLRTRYDHMKVFRPAGTRTACGEASPVPHPAEAGPMVDSIIAGLALKAAMYNFIKEHGHHAGKHGTCVVEIVIEGGARATVLEIPDDGSDVSHG